MIYQCHIEGFHRADDYIEQQANTPESAAIAVVSQLAKAGRISEREDGDEVRVREIHSNAVHRFHVWGEFEPVWRARPMAEHLPPIDWKFNGIKIHL